MPKWTLAHRAFPSIAASDKGPAAPSRHGPASADGPRYLQDRLDVAAKLGHDPRVACMSRQGHPVALLSTSRRLGGAGRAVSRGRSFAKNEALALEPSKVVTGQLPRDL